MRVNWLLLVLVTAAGTVLPGCHSRRGPVVRAKPAPVAPAAPAKVDAEVAKGPAQGMAKAPVQGVGKAPVQGMAKGPVQGVAEGPGPVENAPATRGLARSVKGWGRTQKEAEDDAVKRASEFLTAFLRQLKPPLDMALPPGYVRQHLIRGPAIRQQELENEIQKVVDGVKMQCWALTLAVTPQDYQDLLRLERRSHAQEQRGGRLLVVARVTAWLLAALVAVLAYFRVVGWTRGVSAGRVKLVLVCFLAAAVASLVFFS
jgi:hypothetical protein